MSQPVGTKVRELVTVASLVSLEVMVNTTLGAGCAVTVTGLAVITGVLADVVDECATTLLLILNAGQATVVAMRSLRAVVLTGITAHWQLASASWLRVIDTEGALIVTMLALRADIKTAPLSVHDAGRRLLVGHTSGASLVATLVVRTSIEALIAFHLAEALRLVIGDAIAAFGIAMETLVAAVEALLAL